MARMSSAFSNLGLGECTTEFLSQRYTQKLLAWDITVKTRDSNSNLGFLGITRQTFPEQLVFILPLGAWIQSGQCSPDHGRQLLDGISLTWHRKGGSQPAQVSFSLGRWFLAGTRLTWLGVGGQVLSLAELQAWHLILLSSLLCGGKLQRYKWKLTLNFLSFPLHFLGLFPIAQSEAISDFLSLRCLSKKQMLACLCQKHMYLQHKLLDSRESRLISAEGQLLAEKKGTQRHLRNENIQFLKTW